MENLRGTIGFVEGNVKDVAAGLCQWGRAVGIRFQSREINGSVESLLDSLKPVEPIYTKVLLLATAAPWTAVFANQAQGWHMQENFNAFVRRSNMRGVLVDRNEGEFPSYGFSYFDTTVPSQTITREVVAAFDGDKWDFVEHGPVQPFEEPDLYCQRKIADRMNREILRRAMRRINIVLDSEDFYLTGASCKSVLLERSIKRRFFSFFKQ